MGGKVSDLSDGCPRTWILPATVTEFHLDGIELCIDIEVKGRFL